MKHIFVMMLNRIGEESTTIKTTHEISDDTDVNEFVWDIAKEYHGDDNVEYASNEYYHNHGTVATSILKVEEIPSEDYEVLKKYL